MPALAWASKWRFDSAFIAGKLRPAATTGFGRFIAMKAAYFDQFGGPEVLQYGDLPDPAAAPGEVVVDVHAASVNAADWKFRAGSYERHSNAKPPFIPGRDFSGVIGAVGEGVTDL